MLTGLRYIGLYEGLEVPDFSAVETALSIIAAAGPHTRVAIVPLAGRRIWRYDDSTTPTLHRLPEEVARDGAAAVLQYIRRRPGSRAPFEMHISDTHVAVDIDHGLGDGWFAVDLIQAIYAISCGRPSKWVEKSDATLALPRALAHTLGTHPTHLRGAWRYAKEVKSTRATEAADGRRGASVAWAPSFAVTIARVDLDRESAVDAWRRASATKPGAGAVWLYILRQAFRAAGLQMTGRSKVAFDCRRYLPDPLSVNHNFIIGLDVPLEADETVASISARMREYTASAVPLTGLAAVSALALVRTKSKDSTPSRRDVNVPADLMYTDMGTLSMVDHLPWRANELRAFTGLLDPADPDCVTVFSSKVGGARQLSISFHDNVFERRVIETAAEYLQNPAQFLPPSGL